MRLLSKSYIIIATFFYIGFIPIAPGTIASAATLFVYVFIFSKLSPLIYLISLIALFFLGMWASDATDAFYQTHDNGIIVIDEVLGMLVSLFLIPCTWKNILMAFILFRIFDIVKIPPANILDKRHSGFGTMGDDLISGIYANIFLWLIGSFLL